MAFWLRSAERRVQVQAGKVRADTAAVGIAGRRLATGIRLELAKPKVLLVLFAAGLGVGWLRRSDSGRSRQMAVESEDEGAAVQTGRVAKVVAAVLAGARIYEQVRRAVAFLDEHSRTGAADHATASDYAVDPYGPYGEPYRDAQ